jgi:hypothetical protein
MLSLKIMRVLLSLRKTENSLEKLCLKKSWSWYLESFSLFHCARTCAQGILYSGREADLWAAKAGIANLD